MRDYESCLCRAIAQGRAPTVSSSPFGNTKSRCKGSSNFFFVSINEITNPQREKARNDNTVCVVRDL